MVTTTHLLYLHGFKSSPKSAKARQVHAAVEALRARSQTLTWACPQLPPSPSQAAQDIRQLLAAWPQDTMAVVGSSLGGFYATWAAEQFGCRAAVINPAVDPARDLAHHIGEQTSFHNPDDRFFFRREFIDEFKTLNPYPITHLERYWALIAKGDEVLDWREMSAHYAGATITQLDGSDHAVSDFELHLPDLLRWLGLAESQRP
ncbi:MAG: esterase [Burkholderiales bacterium]|nr:esterase [Burkholderiales bacterium]